MPAAPHSNFLSDLAQIRLQTPRTQNLSTLTAAQNVYVHDMDEELSSFPAGLGGMHGTGEDEPVRKKQADARARRATLAQRYAEKTVAVSDGAASEELPLVKQYKWLWSAAEEGNTDWRERVLCPTQNAIMHWTVEYASILRESFAVGGVASWRSRAVVTARV